jgi:hypothetical protein
MTMARLDAGERGTLADWLRKVRWFFAGYPSYRTALFYDEHRHQITDWVEDESLSREEVIARFEALMPETTTAPRYIHGHNITWTPGVTYTLTRGGRMSTAVDGPCPRCGQWVRLTTHICGLPPYAMEQANGWTSLDTQAAFRDGYRRARKVGVARERLRADKALTRLRAIRELCDEAEALHLTRPGDPRDAGQGLHRPNPRGSRR